MKNSDIQSHNTIIGATGKDFLIPSGSQVLIYFVISVVILTALNITKLWNYLNKDILAPQGGVSTFLLDNIPWLHKFFESLSQSTIIQVIFWLVIGIIVYTIVWFSKNAFINVTNDLVADNYVHPKSYNRSNFWASVLARKIFFGITLLVLGLYLYASIKFLPILATEAYQAIFQFSMPRSLLEMIEAIVGTAIWLHLLLLVIHTAVNSWRLIYRDL